MECATKDCLEESACSHCRMCQYHHDEDIGDLNSYSIKPKMKMNKLKELESIRERLTKIYMDLGNPNYIGADSKLNDDIRLLKKNDVISEKAE